VAEVKKWASLLPALYAVDSAFWVYQQFFASSPHNKVNCKATQAVLLAESSAAAHLNPFIYACLGCPKAGTHFEVKKKQTNNYAVELFFDPVSSMKNILMICLLFVFQSLASLSHM
jgi:hypothetical protein